MSVRASLAVCVGLSVLTAGCDDKTKSDPGKPPSTITIGALPGVTATPEAPPATTPTQGSKLPPPIEGPRDATAALPTSYYFPGDAGRRPGPAAADPDQAVVEAARVQAGHCFDGIPTTGAPSRSASITVVVVGTGRVTRTEVQTPGSTDERLASCLRGVGAGLTFTPKNSATNSGNDTRTFTIDVNVSATR